MSLQSLKNRKVATYIAILLIAMFAFSFYAVLIFSAREASGQVGTGLWGDLKKPPPIPIQGGNNDDSSSSSSSSSSEVPNCACGCGWIVSMCPCD